jgi:16S rRNA (cytosine1402-N4)-methyltransferase
VSGTTLQHVTVLLNEAVAALAPRENGVYVDGTFGRGGHSRLILSRLGPTGRLFAFDRDPAAQASVPTDDARFELIHESFGGMAEALLRRNVGQVDGVLLDLGVSSPQLDDPDRGFSFRHDGPLDMRMDTTRGISAEEWLASAPEEEIREVIREYGEERFAKQIARAIVAARQRGRIRRTGELASLVGEAVRTREPGQHPATRSFQAIRIFINQELEELQIVLPQCVKLLKPEGRLVVISFHSLEDRIVKRFMAHEAKADHLPDRLPVRAGEVNVAKLNLVGRAVKPSDEEVAANPRSRSAIMRVAERTHVAWSHTSAAERH